MKLLLDTHIWLWSLLEPERLSRKVTLELRSPQNEIWLSPISVWETLVLADKRRIRLHPDPASWIRKALEAAPFREARINHEIAIRSRELKCPHQDPADRFLAATAWVYELTLVTADRRLFALRSVSILRNR
jgi:PIN domain nuclease of toxin-antitoxin system